MKRLLFFLSMVSLMTSCTFVGTDTTQVVNLSTWSQDWHANMDVANNIPLYYSRTFSMPEITSSVLEQGMVQAYVVFDGGVQQVLPFVQHFQQTQNLNVWNWTRTIDYRISAGELTVFVTNSDFVADAPPAMNFKVVILP